MFDEIQKAIAEIQQPRSAFQIEKFVLGQHATPEMQYYQTCIELQDLIYKYRLAEINVKKQELKIAKLRATKDELDELKAQEIEIHLEQTKKVMIGAQREIEHLTKLFDSFEHKYTREEIENAQAEYWQKRLTNNAKAMLIAGTQVNPAHIESMQQAGILDEFILEVQTAKKELGL